MSQIGHNPVPRMCSTRPPARRPFCKGTSWALFEWLIHPN